MRMRDKIMLVYNYPVYTLSGRCSCHCTYDNMERSDCNSFEKATQEAVNSSVIILWANYMYIMINRQNDELQIIFNCNLKSLIINRRGFLNGAQLVLVSVFVIIFKQVKITLYTY